MDPAIDLRTSTRFARVVRVLSCVSTQELSMRDAAGDSAVFWADEQTAGRARQGRSWHTAPAVDLAATFRIAGLELDSPTRLAAALPVAVVRAIADIVPEVRIKWPNDVLLHGRKLSGILVDTDGPPPMTYHVGVGLNVNRVTFPEELREHSTSLALAVGREFDRADLLLRVARSLDSVVEQVASGEVDSIVMEFGERIGLLGRQVVARSGEQELAGRLASIDLQRVVLDGVEGETRIALAHLQGLAAR